MDTKELFANNVKKLLATKGWCYANLADNCKGKLSRAYVNSFRTNKVNPSLEVLEIVAEAFGVTVQKLLDPNLDYNRVENGLPEGFKRYDNILLDDIQYVKVKQWAENNKKYIEDFKHQAFLRQQVFHL